MTWHLLEGPDGTGKTTMARKLEQRGFHYEHADASDSLPRLAKRMANLQDLDHVVWDRAHLGELVHGPLDRGTTIDRGWWTLLEAFLQERGAQGHLFIHRWDDRENSPLRHADLQALFQMAASQSNLYWENHTLDGPQFYPMEESDLPFDQRPDPEGLGGLNLTSYEYPLVWILGEQQNPNANVPWPFATRCGIELVWPAVTDLRTTRVSNAIRAGASMADPTELHERWLDLSKPRVICLGNTAKIACLQADVPFDTQLMHPQYHLRFRAKEPEVYRSLLGMAILRAERDALAERRGEPVA